MSKVKEFVEYLIPELKESEDEKIRKRIIQALHGDVLDMEETTKAIAWLEKQDKNNMGISEDTKQKLETNLNKALEKETPESWNKFLNEQKPADKVEPKFKPYDLVVDNCGYAWKIEGILNQFYLLEGVEGGESRPTIEWVNKTFHLWTIQDAKDGDVLSYRDGQWCFIYKGIVTEDTFKYYALLSEKGITVNDAAFSLLASCIIPATKEQCNLLFQKMKEAGYVWNAEKKELRKIEQEENAELTDFESALFSAFSYAWQEYLSGKEVNVAKWAREHSAELLEVAREQKPACAWSEEDETYLDHIITAIKSYYTDDNGKENPWREELLRWLKSFRERYTWKPSDQQMEVLETTLLYNTLNIDDSKLLATLYQDLKKLKD